MIGSKDKMIFEFCTHKDVLDIGCVQLLGDFTPENLKSTQHYQLLSRANRLVGIDLEKDGVDGLNSMGCECYCSFAEDVESLNLDKFDVVLLGDIIEHVPDPSSFLMALRNSLKPDGVILCTTPNALAYSNSLFILFGRPLTSVVS